MNIGDDEKRRIWAMFASAAMANPGTIVDDEGTAYTPAQAADMLLQEYEDRFSDEEQVPAREEGN